MASFQSLSKHLSGWTYKSN